MKEKPLFIILGAGGFPYSQSAASNKYFLLAKALLIKDFDAVLLNKPNKKNNIPQTKGVFEDVKFHFLAGKKRRESVVKKIFAEIIANINLIVQLYHHSTGRNKKFLMISFSSFIEIFFYWILSRLFGYKLLFSVMEYHLAIAGSITERIKSKIFWKFSFSFADGSIPISNFLDNEINKLHENLPTLKIPALADFKSVDLTKNQLPNTKHFLYCGSVGYNDVIDLIINAFLQLNEKDVDLYLVLSGKEKLLSKYEELSILNKNISVFNNLTYEKLTSLYQQSIGLLIPLRPTVQDEARFPQKIPEYLASGTPIISNPVGEMKCYFSDGINVLFAKDYSEESLRDAMRYVIKNPFTAEEIGINGQQFGFQRFHYENIADDFVNFLFSI